MADKPTIAVCIIAKNEMEFIGRALKSVQGADAIYVCDTGSTDNGETVRIAREYTSNVCTDYKWEKSFCKARNHVKSHAKETWVLSLDCDEVIHDFSKVRQAVEFAEANNIRAVDLLQHAEDNTKQTNVFPRLFRNDPDIIWHGNAHNYISILGTLLVEENGVIRVCKDHSDEEKAKALVNLTFGFSLAHLADPNRTLDILESTVKNGEGGARELFYLGREYWYKRRFQEAIDTLNKYCSISVFLQEKAEAFLILAWCYWNMGRGEDARLACMNALVINPHWKEACVVMAQFAGLGSKNPIWENNAKIWLQHARLADDSNVLFRRAVVIPDEPTA